MPKSHIISVFVFLFLSSYSFGGQTTGATVSGKIIEVSTSEPMEFVNAALHNSADSSHVASTVTDKNGDYVFNDVADGNYYVEISFIGFNTQNTSSFSVTESQPVNLGSTAIVISGTTLSDVEVNAEKSIFETSIDKKIYNVSKDASTISGTASEVLANIPSISVDVNGVVSLRGSSNVTILINGKPSPAMRTNSSIALQQIPASSIERIEIITNPSAKYKPDGTAGIINIVLKKETKIGFNGTLIGNFGDNSRRNSSLIMNYKPGKLNLFASYSYRQDYRSRTSRDYRLLYDSAGNKQSEYENNGSSSYRPYSHVMETGFDYSLNKMNDFGISFSYEYFKFKRPVISAVLMYDSADVLQSDYDWVDNNFEYEWEKGLSTYWEHRFKKEDHTLTFEAAFADHFEYEENKNTYAYRVPVLANSFDNTIVTQREQSGEFVLEYANPIREEVEIEAGYTLSFINQDFDFYGEYYVDSLDAFMKDENRSNLFRFSQSVHALYATYSQGIEDFSFMLGLRGENAFITSNLVTLDSIVKNDYFKLYPTVHLSYELGDEMELQLSYSRRVNRPEGDELNPFPVYSDPTTLEAGNPKLMPEQVHAFELSYFFRNDKITFMPTIYYRRTFDAFTEVSKNINDSTLLISFENLKSDESAGLEFILAFKVKKILTLNLSANGYYNRIDASNLGYSEEKSIFTWDTKLSAGINAWKNAVIQINTTYRAASLTPQGKYLPMFVMNAGFRQNILKKKASVTLTVSDVFNTMRWSSEINTRWLYQEQLYKRKSQIIYVGFIYHFGKTEKKTAEELKFDEGK